MYWGSFANWELAKLPKYLNKLQSTNYYIRHFSQKWPAYTYRGLVGLADPCDALVERARALGGRVSAKVHAGEPGLAGSRAERGPRRQGQNTNVKSAFSYTQHTSAYIYNSSILAINERRFRCLRTSSVMQRWILSGLPLSESQILRRILELRLRVWR